MPLFYKRARGLRYTRYLREFCSGVSKFFSTFLDAFTRLTFPAIVFRIDKMLLLPLIHQFIYIVYVFRLTTTCMFHPYSPTGHRVPGFIFHPSISNTHLNPAVQAGLRRLLSPTWIVAFRNCLCLSTSISLIPLLYLLTMSGLCRIPPPRTTLSTCPKLSHSIGCGFGFISFISNR